MSGGWVKSSFSQSEGTCVEMRTVDGAVHVRDSKDPDGPQLRFTPAEFRAWLAGAQHGEFDHLA